MFLGLALAASTGSADEVVRAKEIVEIVEPAPLLEFNITAAWDSRYVSEGRDNLDGNSLLSATVEAAYLGLPFGEVLLGSWYGWTPNRAAYAELNLYFEYGFEIGDFSAYAGYNHLHFHPDDLHDNEIGAGVSYALPYGLTPGADWVYSSEANGSYFEVYLEGEVEITPWLVLNPAVTTGFNAGYVSDGHSGHNNVAVILGAAIPVGDNVEIGGYVAYTWGVNVAPDRFGDDEILSDFLYGGVSVTLSF
jgi:hypothetical protein